MAAPANDNIADRLILGASGSITPIAIDDATTETDEPAGSALTNGVHQSVWFEWTAPADGLAVFATEGSVATDGNGDSHGGLDTTLSAWTGDPTDMTSLIEAASNDDDATLGSGHFTSRISFSATSGTTYFIQAGTYDTPYTGSLHLSFGFTEITFVGPDNNSCANAYVLTGCGGRVVADNRGWAGTWPIGADPLFNALTVGGGAPLFFTWTNTRGRPMLFRVTLSEPDDNAVNYNFGVGIAADCAGLVFQNDDDDFVTSRFNLAEEFGNLQEQFVASNVDPSSPDSFDLVVDPGHTVWFEVDSYSGDASEPPDATADLGKFKFDWSALEFTSFDTTQGAQDVFPADVSTLLDNDASSTGASNTTPYATKIVGGHLYLLFVVNEAHGDSIFAGDSNLDGSSLNVQRVWDASTADPGGFIQGDVPRLLSDGTDVFVGFGWQEGTDTRPNPGYTDSCSRHAPVAVCDECDSLARAYRYSIFKFAGAGAWDELVAPSGPDPRLLVYQPDLSYMGLDINYREFNVRACASEAQPGTILVHAAYRVTQVDQSLHFNEHPTTETPPGALYCTNDKVYVVEYVQTNEIDVATRFVTETRAQSELGIVQEWVSDDPTVNPAFGAWQTFMDGDLVTDTSTPRDSILYGGFDLRNDDGYPLLAYCHRAGFVPSGLVSSYANDIVFERLDTASTLGTWSYDDIAGGYETDSSRGCSILAITDRFTDPDDSTVKRGLATNWPGSPIRDWSNLIVSDGSSAPTYIVAGDVDSSLGWFFGWVFPDTLKDGNRQWWAKSGPLPSDPVLDNTFEHYDYCDTPGWKATWDGFHGPDDLGADYVISPFSAYDTDAEIFYFLVGNDQLRSAAVLRNYFICNEGEPCSGAVATGLYADVIF